MADQPLEYATKGTAEPRRGSTTGSKIIACLLIAFIVFMIASYPVGWAMRERRIDREIACGQQLRSIGQAILQYAQGNSGQYPPDLATLAGAGLIRADILACPSSDEEPATSSAELSQPGHCSYVYTGAGLTTESRDCVVAFDDPASHDARGIMLGTWVLYADGHVSWENFEYVVAVMKDMAAGRYPADGRQYISSAAAQQEYERNWRSRMAQFKSSGWRIPTTQQTTQPPEGN